MKALPAKLRHDSLSAHTDQISSLEGEAGDRAQSDSRYGLTLAREFGEELFSPKSLMLTGSSYEETDSEKATYEGAGRKHEKPDFARD